MPVTVITNENVVQLSGLVDSQAQRQRALDIARTMKGVKKVNDAIVVKKY